MPNSDTMAGTHALAARAALLALGVPAARISFVCGPDKPESVTLTLGIVVTGAAQASEVIPADAPEGTTASATVDLLVINCGPLLITLDQLPAGTTIEQVEEQMKPEWDHACAEFDAQREDQRKARREAFYGEFEMEELRKALKSRGLL